MSDRPNILFIIFDDLRPELGCYGQSHMHTPNIDRLGVSSVQFNRAYCQIPVCGASRASLFTGLRPTRQRFTDYLTWIDQDAPDTLALHEHLRRHGYVTAAHGKVLHHAKDRLAGWTHPPVDPEEYFPIYANPDNRAQSDRRQQAIARGEKPPRRAFPWEIGGEDVDEMSYSDGPMVQRVIDQMKQAAASDQPFFIGAGFHRPHLPFLAPKKYWDLYDRDAIELPGNPAPANVPAQAMHSFGELRTYAGMPDDGPLDEQSARTLIHGYRASVSYIDALIGRLLDALDQQGLADNTIVFFGADHGFILGEHGLWCKHCLFETPLRVPLLMRVPGMAAGHCDALVENLDIYPTLCDLLDLPAPEHLAGRSLVPQLRDPNAPGKTAVLSRFIDGDSVRNDQYRYTQYRQADGTVLGDMLFDLHADPGETINLADDPQHRQTVEQLAALLPPPG